MTHQTRLRALIDAANHAMPIAHADEGKAPHMQRLFASRQYAELRFAIFNLTGEDSDWELARAALCEVGMDITEMAA